MSAFPNELSYSFNGRTSIGCVLESWGIRRGDEVLVPSWVCSSVLEPYRYLGASVRFYHVSPRSFAIDLNDLEANLSSATRVIHVINYFNVLQDWKGLKAIVPASVRLLEDNAYSLLTRQRQFLRLHADAAIYSFRKVLNVPGGGAFYPRGKDLSAGPLIHSVEIKRLLLPYSRSSYATTMFAIYRFCATVLRRSTSVPDSEGSEPSFASIKEKGISRVSRRAFKKQWRVYDQLVIDQEKRRVFLLDQLRTIPKLQFDGSLPGHDESNVVTVYIPDRDATFARLARDRYPVMVWPDLPLQILQHPRADGQEAEIGARTMQIFIDPRVRLEVYEQLARELGKVVEANRG
jgi:hypothetical protein